MLNKLDRPDPQETMDAKSGDPKAPEPEPGRGCLCVCDKTHSSASTSVGAEVDPGGG
jgi:hypothetical protein